MLGCVQAVSAGLVYVYSKQTDAPHTHTDTHSWHTLIQWMPLARLLLILMSPYNPFCSPLFDLYSFCVKNNEDHIANTSNKSNVIAMNVGGCVFNLNKTNSLSALLHVALVICNQFTQVCLQKDVALEKCNAFTLVCHGTERKTIPPNKKKTSCVLTWLFEEQKC